jgi:hypothetical protein
VNLGRDTLLELTALLAVLAFALLSVKTFFREGIPPGWDHPPHLVCSYLTSEFFLPQLTVLGWDPYNNFGWVFNQFYNPGAYLLVAVIRYASFKLLDVVSSYKLALIVTYVLPAIGAFYLAKAMGGGLPAAALAALFSVVVTPYESEWLDAGLKQLYYIGMWPERLGIGFALLALAAEWSALSGRGWERLQKATISAFLCAAAILSHLMTGIALLMTETLIAVIFAVRRFAAQEGGLKAGTASALPGLAWDAATFAVAVGGALGLLAFWVVPLSQANWTYHNLPTITWYVGPWGVNTFLGSLGPLVTALFVISVAVSCVSAKRGFAPVTATAAVSAFLMWAVSTASPLDGYLGLRLILASTLLALVAVFSGKPGAATLASAISMLLVIATGPDSFRFRVLWWGVDLSKVLPFSESYAYYKFAGLARYMAFTAAALGTSSLLAKAFSLVRGLKSSEAQLGYVGVGVAALLLVAVVAAQHFQLTDFYYPYSETLIFKMDTDFPGTLKLVRIMEWVRENVPENTYVFYQDTLWKLGDWSYLPVSHYFYLSSMLTGKPQVGGGFGTRYITHPLANTEADHLLGQPISWLAQRPERVYDIARELGISYFVIFDQSLIAALKSRPDLFVEVYAEPPFHVFKTSTFNSIVEAVNGEIVQVDIEPNVFAVKYRAANFTTIRIRQVFYPGWRAFVDDREIPLGSYNPDVPSYVWVPGDGVIANYRVPFIEVQVPPGDHVLVLKYRASTWGDSASVTALAALLFLNLVPVARKLSPRRLNSPVNASIPARDSAR